MLLSEQVLSIALSVIELSKPYEDRYTGEIKKKEGNYPEYWNGYNDAVNNLNKIKVHSEKGFFPHEMFEKRSPNQTDEELKWIKDNYKQTTLTVFNDFINTRGRAWHKSNWSLKLNEENSLFDGNTFGEYIEDGLEVFGSLEYVMKDVIPVLKAKDAEGVISIKPNKINLIENEDGSFSLDDRVLLEPQIKYFDSSKIVYQNEGRFMIETGEKSIVEYNGNKKPMGRVFEFYDESNIWRIEQVGKKVDYEFKINLFLFHDLGYTPVHKLMGIPRIDNNTVNWESPFLHAVDLLDLVLLDGSHLAMSKAKSVYPVRVMAANECEHEEGGIRCNNGSLMYFDEKLGTEISKTCSSCGGSGLIHRVSPLGELLFNPKELDEGNAGRSLLEYVSPSVTTLEFLDAQMKGNEETARKILHLNTTGQKANGREDVTATSKALENKALMAFIKSIAEQEFYLFDWALTTIGKMRYGEQFAGYNLNKPTSFDFTTEEDYINQIARAKESGVPPIALRFILVKYVKSVFGSNESQSKVIDLVVSVDRLLELDSEEIDVKRASGLIADWEDVIHSSGVSLVSELIDLNDNFLELPLDQKKEQLIALAKVKVAGINTDVIA